VLTINRDNAKSSKQLQKTVEKHGKKREKEGKKQEVAG